MIDNSGSEPKELVFSVTQERRRRRRPTPVQLASAADTIPFTNGSDGDVVDRPPCNGVICRAFAAATRHWREWLAGEAPNRVPATRRDETTDQLQTLVRSATAAGND